MDINGLGSRVEQTQIFFHFANPADGRLQNPFDKYPFLGMHDLVVAEFKLPVNVDVLYVQTREVLEDLVVRPGLDVLNCS